MTPERPEHVAVGRVVGTHGLRGALRVEVLSDFPGVFKKRRQLLIGESFRPVDVVTASVTGPSAIVRLAGVETVEAASTLRNEYLYVATADAARPPSGEFLWHEIVGLPVETDDGRALGRVEEILRTGANDVYVVRGPLGELLIPAIADVVKDLDPAAGRILVHAIPGLLPGEDEPARSAGAASAATSRRSRSARSGTRRRSGS